MEIKDFRIRDTGLLGAVGEVNPAGVSRVVIENRWWRSLKYSIRMFIVKYCRELAQDKTKPEKYIEDRLTRRGSPGNSTT